GAHRECVTYTPAALYGNLGRPGASGPRLRRRRALGRFGSLLRGGRLWGDTRVRPAPHGTQSGVVHHGERRAALRPGLLVHAYGVIWSGVRSGGVRRIVDDGDDVARPVRRRDFPISTPSAARSAQCGTGVDCVGRPDDGSPRTSLPVFARRKDRLERGVSR